MKIFITGGAGYIGSHTVKALGKAGHEVLVYDDLSTGNKWAVPAGTLIKADLSDRSYLDVVMRQFKPDAVMHFAAFIQVEESIRLPLKYYRNNVGNSMNLLDAMNRNGIRNLIYSSTAAVYGIPKRIPVDETAPLNPINPYGKSKVMVEKMLEDLSRTTDFRYIALRYFNVAGADPEGELGQTFPEATNLITRALKVAAGEIGKLQIFGTDYPTPDGTCIRDYIHVTDLADAHLAVLDYLVSKRKSEVMNCGYCRGFSVRQVVDAVQRVTGRCIPLAEAGRRPGDPPAVVAYSTKLQMKTSWQPRYDNLEYIIRTAWDWEQKLGGKSTVHTRAPAAGALAVAAPGVAPAAA
jgi:UDP-glucose 4-epimerase